MAMLVKNLTHNGETYPEAVVKIAPVFLPYWLKDTPNHPPRNTTPISPKPPASRKANRAGATPTSIARTSCRNTGMRPTVETEVASG